MYNANVKADMLKFKIYKIEYFTLLNSITAYTTLILYTNVYLINSLQIPSNSIELLLLHGASGLAGRLGSGSWQTWV